MNQIGKSFLKGAEEALAYAKGQTKGVRSHKVKILKHKTNSAYLIDGRKFNI